MFSNILSTFNSDPTHFYTFNYTDNWIYSDSSEEFGNLEQNIVDFTLDQNRLFLSSIYLNSGTNSENP